MPSKVRALLALGALTALAAVTTLNPLSKVSGQDKEAPTRKVEKQGEKKTAEKDEKKSEAPVPVKIAEPKREDRSKKTESPPIKGDEKIPKVEGKVPMTSDEKVPGSRPGEKKDDPGSPRKKGDEKNSKETMPEKGKPVPGNVKTESTEPKVERGQAGANSEEMTHEGQLIAITGNRLTMMLKDGKQRAFQLMGDARLTLDGKASRATDLKPGIMLRVTTPTTEQGAAIRVEGQSKSPNPVENTRVPKKETLFPIPEGQAKSRDCECHAQNAANNWIFGTRARINFGGNPPSSSVTTSLPVSNAFNTAEGCSTISDASGNLLFYTDGTTVWDKNHNPMPNGTGLMGNSTSTQSALIVPCSCDKYFVFTTDGMENQYANGLRYSLVDMTLSSGMGEVTSTKNILLLANSSEKVAGVSDGSGGFWVVAHTMDDNKFYSYRILPDGTCTPQPPVISAVGSNYTGGWGDFGQGQMKFSPDGKLLAHAGLNTETAGGPLSFVELFKFSAGVVSDYIPGTARATTPNRFYGLEFSPNSQSLWATTTQSTSAVYHYPIGSSGLGTPTPINPPGSGVAALQLGPDGKIYVARIGQPSLYVLPSPNAVNGGWISPTDTANLLPLAAGSSSQYGLPTVIAGDYCGSIAGCNCCPGENPLTNGDFEDAPIGQAEPPVWPGITSQYAASNSFGPGATLPGEYNIVNGTQALNICSNWALADHCTCLDAPGKFMVVNGRTGQTGSKSIWKQTVAVTAGEYKFCAFAKNLPQCCFDVQPKIEVKFSGVGIGTGANIPPTVVNMSGVPCRWQLITASITVPSGTTSLTIDILLDETGQGDGNDLALDDISFQLKPPVPANYVSFGFENPNFIDATHYTLTANYPPNLPLPSNNQNCGYFWEVCQLNEISPNSVVLANTTASNWQQWWTFPNTTFNDFQGYDGSNMPAFPGGPGGPNPGVFETGKYYRVTFGAWCDCQGWRQSSLEFRYNVQLRKLEVSQPDAGRVPEVKVERRQRPTVDSKLEQPNLQRPKFEPRPEPKPEMKRAPIDESKLPREGAVTIRVGEFISYKDGNLTLAIAAKTGDEPKATVFARVTAIAIDPLDPLGMKKLPAEEVFSGMKVGTKVNVMTNKRGEFTFSVAYERAPNPKPEMKTAPIDESKLPRARVEPKRVPVTPEVPGGIAAEGAVTTRVGEFISYKDGNLTLNIAAKTGDRPKATVFARVTAIAIDPLDPLGMKKLPAEEVFSGMKVGTKVNVMTNKRGEFTFSVAYERARNPELPRQ